MKKKLLKVISSIVLIATLVVALSSCDPKYETITQNAGNYEYQLGETAKIIDIATNKVIAELTVESCELVDDKPFTVLIETHENDDGEKDYKEVEYVALYEVTFDFDDSQDHVTTPQRHFKSEELNFTINPTDRKSKNDTFFVGLRKGSGGDSTIDLSFTYDSAQDRKTALFKIPIDKVVEETDDPGKYVIVPFDGYNNIDSISSDNDDDDNKDSANRGGVIAGIFAVILMLLLFGVFMIIPVLGLVGFIKSLKNSKLINQQQQKINELEYKLAYIEQRTLFVDSKAETEVSTKDEKPTEEKPAETSEDKTEE